MTILKPAAANTSASFRAIAVVFAVAVGAAVSTPAMAEKCSGRWGGEVPTTVTFLDGGKLRYCFRSQCWTNPWTGDKAAKVTFFVGGGNAKATMKAADGGYRATWSSGTNSSIAKLTCK